MDLQDRAKEIAAKANECCERSDGYEEAVESVALRHLTEAVERLTAENERLAAGRDAAIRTLADSRFPPVTRINDAIAILSRSGVVQQNALHSEE